MVIVILLVVVVGAIIYFRMSGDSTEVKARYKGRPESQKQVIRYFMNDGCLQKKMSDVQYDAMVQTQIDGINAKGRALQKIGLDESELQEIEPVHFEGYVFGKKAYAKRGVDGKWRSSAYQQSWLFFSATQVYLWQYTFNMDEDGKKEVTEEYFYKDITNFSTSSDTEETPYWDPKLKKNMLQNVDSNRFRLVVPGDSFYCAMDQNDYTERAIQGMKAKLREKKNV
jgi:hypothetical protein